MIYTVTFSPAIDYFLDFNDLELGKINHAHKVNIVSGGKGINVSKVLSNFGMESIALGYVGGKTCDLFIKGLNEYQNIKTDFIKIKEDTRINVKINTPIESALDAPNPNIDKEEEKKLFLKLDKLNKDDIVVFSGEFPINFNKELYLNALKKFNNKGIKFIIDTSNEILLDSLKYHPFFIKPNIEELSSFFHKDISFIEEAKIYGDKLIELGALNVLISLGKDGAIFVSKNEKIYQKSPQIDVISTVGAGDTMVASFIYSYLLDNDFAKALAFSIKASSLTCKLGRLVKKEDINDY